MCDSMLSMNYSVQRTPQEVGRYVKTPFAEGCFLHVRIWIFPFPSHIRDYSSFSAGLYIDVLIMRFPLRTWNESPSLSCSRTSCWTNGVLQYLGSSELSLDSTFHVCAEPRGYTLVRCVGRRQAANDDKGDIVAEYS